jgi:polyisoprenoid-binding protein YceI
LVVRGVAGELGPALLLCERALAVAGRHPRVLAQYADAAHSSVRLTATRTFGLKPVDATVAVRSGTVMVGTRPEQSTVSADLDAAGFTTDDPRRDRDVRGKRFLDAATFPAIGFRSTRVVKAAEGWQIVGVLSVRGGSTEVTLQVTEVMPTVDGYRFTATTTVDRAAAGIRSAVVGRLIQIRLTVVVTGG